MSSALLSTSSIPEITHQSKPNEDVKSTLRQSYSRPLYIQPPDKGWGWVVVFSAFCCSAIVDGLIFSSPCVFGLLLDDVHASYWVTLFCAAVQIFSYLVVGPIISRFLRQDTCRNFVCCGAVVATSGFIFSAVVANELSPEFYFIIVLTLGLAVGCGLGCIYISSICAVSCFFVRHRIAATTIALSGSGVGMTVFPPLLAHFTKALDFYQAMFYFAAIAFQTLFLGVLIWPLSELPPGCDLHAGQLPREKDFFDYIRERVGIYPRSIAGSRESDISMHARQDAVKVARERRLTRLRNESECDSQCTPKAEANRSNCSSPQMLVAASPARDPLNKRVKRARTNSEAPMPSPSSSRSGSGTPVVHLHKTALPLSSSVENHLSLTNQHNHSFSRPQSTVPDQIFSTASQATSPVPHLSTADMQSIAGGASMVENISVITDLGRRLDACSDVTEFFIILDPQEGAKKSSAGVPHGQRQKSVSECIYPNGSSFAGVLITEESFTHTDIVPPSHSSIGDQQSRGEHETFVPENTDSIQPVSTGDGVNFLIGGAPDEEKNPPLGNESPMLDEKNDYEYTQGNAPRIDGDAAEVLNGLEPVNGKRLYRRQSSGYSGRLALLKQRSLQKVEQTNTPERTPKANGTPPSSDAVLQLLMKEQKTLGNSDTPVDVSGDESPATRSEANINYKRAASNGQLPGTPHSASISGRKEKEEEEEQPEEEATAPPWLVKCCPWLAKVLDIRLFCHGPSFPILCLANAFAMAGVFVPLVFLPLRVIWLDGLRLTLFPETEGIRSPQNALYLARLKAGFLIAIAGSVGCIARLGVVIGTELRRSNSLVTTCIAFFVKSIIVVSTPLISDFAVLAVMLAFIAVCTELYVSMTTSIIRWSFQPEGTLGGYCDPSLVNPAFSFLTIIRAFSAFIGICFSGFLFSFADPFGSCLLVIPYSPFRAYGAELPSKPDSCEEAFANIMYFAGSVFFVSFILHSSLLVGYAVRIYKTKKVNANSPEAGNGTFLLHKIDGSRLDV